MSLVYYVDRSALTDPIDSTIYVYDYLRHKYPSLLVHDEITEPATKADVVFNRFDIPWSKDFLEKLNEHSSDKVHVNHPISKVNLQSKEYLLNFPEIIPESIVVNNVEELTDFYNAHDTILIKPLSENQGKGIKKLGGEYRHSLDDVFKDYSRNYGRFMAQRYLEEISEVGDKRINVVDYNPVSAYLRMPETGSYLANTHRGAKVHKANMTKSDYELVDRITPFLKENGLLWVGIDVIGDYLGEINVSSPGGLKRADYLNNNQEGLSSVKKMVDKYLN